MKYTCPCCGYMVLDSEHEYDICPICFWEDDFIQYEEPYYVGGANGVSLYEAQANYRHFGACDKKCLSSVRKPTIYDRLDENWEPLQSVCDMFLEWLNKHAIELAGAGVITEEVKIVKDNPSEFPSVTAYHYIPDQFIGIITVWDNNVVYLEIQNYVEGETVLLMHEEIEGKLDFDEILKEYLLKMKNL